MSLASDANPTMPPPRGHRFPRRLRLTQDREYRAVFDARTSNRLGPMIVYTRPNDLGHPRLGLSISRRVGGAVVRTRLKRLLRDAFRIMQHDLPPGYDMVIIMRRHDPQSLAEYQRLLSQCVRRLHKIWTRRESEGDA